MVQWSLDRGSRTATTSRASFRTESDRCCDHRVDRPLRRGEQRGARRLRAGEREISFFAYSPRRRHARTQEGSVPAAESETPGMQVRGAWRRPILYTASLVALTDAVGVGYVLDHGPLQQERTQCALQPSVKCNQCRSSRTSSSR